MEILQTIWTALTTENEMLGNLIFLPINLIETFLNMSIFTLLLKINYTNKVKMKYLFIGTIILYVNGIFIPNPYRSFLNMILFIILNMYLFKINLLKSILAMMIPALITGLCESILIKIATMIFSFNIIDLSAIPIYRVIITLFIQFLVFIVYLFIKNFKISLHVFDNLSQKNKIIFLSNLVLALLATSVQLIITGYYLNILPLYIVVLSNLSLFGYIILSIYSLIRTSQFEITSLNLEQEKENNRILTALQDDLRGFRHDFSNIMCTISGFVQVKDMEGLSKYYSGIQKDITKVNNLGSLNPETINNPAIFTLIASKYNKALEDGIEMNIKIFLDLNTLNIKIYEFTRILGILLDNSIEAAKECDDKIINLEIRNDEKRNRQILILENTYNNKDIDTEKIYEKNYSTKSKNTGLGLWEIRQIIKKNNNLNLFTSKDEKYFKQQLEMYN